MLLPIHVLRENLHAVIPSQPEASDTEQKPSRLSKALKYGLIGAGLGAAAYGANKAYTLHKARTAEPPKIFNQKKSMQGILRKTRMENFKDTLDNPPEKVSLKAPRPSQAMSSFKKYFGFGASKKPEAVSAMYDRVNDLRSQQGARPIKKPAELAKQAVVKARKDHQERLEQTAQQAKNSEFAHAKKSFVHSILRMSTNDTFGSLRENYQVQGSLPPRFPPPPDRGLGSNFGYPERPQYSYGHPSDFSGEEAPRKRSKIWKGLLAAGGIGAGLYAGYRWGQNSVAHDRNKGSWSHKWFGSDSKTPKTAETTTKATTTNTPKNVHDMEIPAFARRLDTYQSTAANNSPQQGDSSSGSVGGFGKNYVHSLRKKKGAELLASDQTNAFGNLRERPRINKNSLKRLRMSTSTYFGNLVETDNQNEEDTSRWGRFKKGAKDLGQRALPHLKRYGKSVVRHVALDAVLAPVFGRKPSVRQSVLRGLGSRAIGDLLYYAGS